MAIIAFLNLELHDDGAMSISGNVGDWKMCRNMLDAAHTALRQKQTEGEPMQTKIITDTGKALQV